MSDLIKRSDAIEAIEVVDWYHQNRNKDMVGGANSAEHQAWYKAQDIYNALEAVPSADRPQGEWIKDKSKNIWNMVVDCYKCSNCGKKAIDHSLILDTTGLSYCPNCGARMKGADDGDSI